jgi:hypothetical protein
MRHRHIPSSRHQSGDSRGATKSERDVVTNIAICAIMALLFNTGLWAGEPPTIVFETPKKEFKPQEAARVQMYDGLPGVEAKSPPGFATIFRFTEYGNMPGDGVRIDVGDVPRWLSKQLTKDEKALLNEEQLKLLEEMEAEAVIIRPLAKKMGELAARQISTFNTMQNMVQSNDKAVRKATANNDRAALSEEAQRVRSSRIKNASNAWQDAQRDFGAWSGSPDYAAMEFSKAKLRKMFAAAMSKYPVVKEKK